MEITKKNLKNLDLWNISIDTMLIVKIVTAGITQCTKESQELEKKIKRSESMNLIMTIIVISVVLVFTAYTVYDIHERRKEYRSESSLDREVYRKVRND